MAKLIYQLNSRLSILGTGNKLLIPDNTTTMAKLLFAQPLSDITKIELAISGFQVNSSFGYRSYFLDLIAYFSLLDNNDNDISNTNKSTTTEFDTVQSNSFTVVTKDQKNVIPVSDGQIISGINLAGILYVPASGGSGTDTQYIYITANCYREV